MNLNTLLKNSKFIFGLIISITFFPSCQEEQAPNIIFIMSDDHSTGAISAYGKSLVKTPNIDMLAEQGMRFNNCLNVVSLCGPSRAAIISGRYSMHNGYKRNGDLFDRNQYTIPQSMQQGGYQTALFGKWHLLTEPAGFDYYNILPGQGSYFNSRFKETGQEWEDGGKGGKSQKGYTTELITDNAIEWIKNRDNTKPFFAMVHHKAPHTPYRYPEKYKKLFADIDFEEPENFYDEFEGKNPDLVNNECVFSKFLTIDPAHFAEEVPDSIEYGTLAYKKWGYQSILKGYYRLVTAMDENIGRLMDFVDESGLAENTIVIYTSDNGWFMGDHGLFNKMWMYDESLRVPLIVRYPGKIKAGSVNDDIVSVLDFGPTFSDYASMDEDKRFQGTSFKDILHGRTPKNRESAHFYHYFEQWGVPSHYGVRTEDYKLIHFYEAKEEPKWELYDMKKDPKEMVNLVYNNEYKSVLEDMKQQLAERKRLCEETPIEQ